MNLFHQIAGTSGTSLQTIPNPIEKNDKNLESIRPKKSIHADDFLDVEGTGLPQNAHQICPRSRPTGCHPAHSPIASGELQAKIARQADGEKQATQLPDETVPLQPVNDSPNANTAHEGGSCAMPSTGGENHSATDTGAPDETTTPAPAGQGESAANANPPSENDNGAPSEAAAGPQETPGAANPSTAGDESSTESPPAATEASPNGQNGAEANAGANANGAEQNPAAGADAPAGQTNAGLPTPNAPQAEAPAVAPGAVQVPTTGAPTGPGPVANPGMPTVPPTPQGAPAPASNPALFPGVFVGAPPATGGHLNPTFGPAPTPTAMGDLAVVPAGAVGAAIQAAPMLGANPAPQAAGAILAPGGLIAAFQEQMSKLPASLQNALKTLLLLLLSKLPADVLAGAAQAKAALGRILQAFAGLVQKLVAGLQPQNAPAGADNGTNLARQNQTAQTFGQAGQVGLEKSWQQQLDPNAKDIRWAAPFGQHEWKDNVLHIKGGAYRGCRGFYDKKACKLRVFTESGKHVANQHVDHEKGGRPRVSSPLAAAAVS